MIEQKTTISNYDKKNAMIALLPYIVACPQMIKPEIGLEEFVEQLNRAATKYAEYTDISNRVQKPS